MKIIKYWKNSILFNLLKMAAVAGLGTILVFYPQEVTVEAIVLIGYIFYLDVVGIIIDLTERYLKNKKHNKKDEMHT